MYAASPEASSRLGSRFLPKSTALDLTWLRGALLLSCCPWQRVLPPFSFRSTIWPSLFTSVLHLGLLGPFPAALPSQCFLRHTHLPSCHVPRVVTVQVGVPDGHYPFHCNIYSWAAFLTFIPQCLAAELFCCFLFVAKGFMQPNSSSSSQGRFAQLARCVRLWRLQAMIF